MNPGGVSNSKEEGREPPCDWLEGVCGDLGCIQMGVELVH